MHGCPLNPEQCDNDDKKEYFEMQVDFNDDKTNELEFAVSKLKTLIDDAESASICRSTSLTKGRRS